MQSHSKKHAPVPARSRLAAAARRATPAVVQPMERRVLMSAAVLANGVLTVTGTAGADTIDVAGGEAADGTASLNVTVNGTSQTFVPSQVTAVVINAGDGKDNVTVTQHGTALPPVTVNGGVGDDTITATPVPDDAMFTFNGGDGNDSLSVGSDMLALATLTGGAGDDTIVVGEDTQANVDGGDGNDLIMLTFAIRSVTVVGGAGTDTLEVDPYYTTNLTLNLDGRPDSLLYGSTPATLGADIENVTVNPGGGGNVAGLSVTGDALDNVITARDVFNGATIHGGSGNDRIVLSGIGSTSHLYGDAGDDTLVTDGTPAVFSGGDGTDVVDLSAVTSDQVLYLDGSRPSNPGSDNDPNFASGFDGTVEQVYGGSGNDLIVATPGGGDALYGNGGNDTLIAQGGADALFGGIGVDTLNARDGGSTYVDGGPGTDTAYVDATGDTTLNVEAVVPPSIGMPAKLTGSTYGTAGSYGNGGNTIAKATDGDVNTYFDAPTQGGNVGIDLGAAKAVAQIRFAPRSGYAGRMVGGLFQYSTSPTFASGNVTVYTVTAAPAQGVLTTVTLAAPVTARYWRYLGPTNGYGNIAEFQLYGTGSTTPTPAKLTGTTYGTAGSYGNGGNTIARATDGDLNTYFDAPTQGGNVGIDLGAAKAVTQIRFAPRSGYAGRMVGGVFQYSTSATFASGVTTVYTVTAAPPQGALTTVTLSAPATARYWRYLGPTNGYGNIAEFQLFG